MITYQQEDLNDIREELEPLLVEHYHEVAMYQDKIDLNPDWKGYELLSMANALHVYTARANQELIAYTVNIVQPNMHYKDHVYAVNDVIYVDPQYRHTEVAETLIQNSEELLKELGVSVMTFHMKTFKTFEALMDHLDFDKAEYLYMKYIKED